MAKVSHLFHRVCQTLITCYHNFETFLFQPCNPTPLCIFRFLFGVLMVLDVPQERGLEDADLRFGDPNYCFFPLFTWVIPLPLKWACIWYSVMWLGAVGIALGFKFRVSCLLYLVPYLYFFLLDKSRWNNHSYLFALITMLLWGSGAGDYLSLDNLISRQKTKKDKPRDNHTTVPKWNYFILRFQLFLLYFFAGIQKLDEDWISGYSMRSLGKNKMFAPLKSICNEEIIEYYFIHMGGLCYDLSVGFLLNIQTAKKLAFFLSFMFHGLNSQIFDIGMFPYVCLASLILFCEPWEFPCNLFVPAALDKPNKLTKRTNALKPTKTIVQNRNVSTDETKYKRKRSTATLLIFYIALQLFLPFSHFITKGYNNWTKGLYGYSWDMMVNSWETLHIKITVRNRVTGQERYLDPDVWVANDRWSSHADQAIQYAECVSRNLARFNITDIGIYLDVWKSLNGRFQQRIYDPHVDILQAGKEWSPFMSVKWVLPVLREFSHYRKTHFDSISQSVARWNNFSDVIFVADFPGLTFENFLSSHLTNVSVTILEGEILVEQEGQPNVTLSPFGSKSQFVSGGAFHKIHTVSLPKASTYMYTYTNGTKQREEYNAASSSSPEMNETHHQITVDTFYHLVTSLKHFLDEKYDVFLRSFNLIADAYLNIVWDIPMTIRKQVPIESTE